MQSRNNDQRHRHMDDRADTLPTEGSHYAIQEDAIVDQTFLQQRKRQRDVHNKQLRAPVCASDPYDNTGFFRDAISVSPPFSPLDREPHTPSSADHDTCTSFMQACSAIFTPKHAQCVVLHSSPYIRFAQEHDQQFQNWITHRRSSATRFKPDLIECEDVLVCGQMSVLRQRAFLHRPRYGALFSTVCIVSHAQG